MSAIVKERSNVLNVEVSKRDVNGNDRRNNEELELHRNMIVFADLGDIEENNSNSVQKGKRPVLICSNNANNRFSPNVTCVILTTKITKRPLPTHVLLTKENTPCLLKDSVCCCEQIVTLPKTSIERIIGTVSDKVMQEVNKAMMIQLGLM